MIRRAAAIGSGSAAGGLGEKAESDVGVIMQQSSR
jgi:hypothetical protein